MPKASVYIALFLISVNAAAGMLQVTGVAADLGIGVQDEAPEELEQAQQEIRDLKLDQSFQKAWMDPQAPGHQAAVEKLQALYEEAYPNG